MYKEDALMRAVEIAKEFARSGQAPGYIPKLIQETYDKIIEIAKENGSLGD